MNKKATLNPGLKGPQTHPKLRKALECYKENKVSVSIHILEELALVDDSALVLESKLCLSLIYNDIGKYQVAAQNFNQILIQIDQRSKTEDSVLNYFFARKHQEIAELYLRDQQFDEAITAYSQAIQIAPEIIEFRLGRAQAYAQKGWTHRAFQELNQLKLEFPKSIYPSQHLGLLHYEEENYLDAEIEWERVLSIDPNEQETQKLLEQSKQFRQGQLKNKLSNPLKRESLKPFSKKLPQPPGQH